MSLQGTIVRRAFAAALTSALWAAPMAAHAQAAAEPVAQPTVTAPTAAELAARRALIEQAETARQAGQHAEALTFAERAAAIQMTPSLRLFIAREQQAMRLYASALGNTEVCIRDAERDDSLRNREEIIAGCRTITSEINASSGRIVVRLPNAPAGTEVFVGTERLPLSLIDAPYTVATGSVTVRVSVPQRRPFDRTVNVERGATQTIAVELQLVEGDSPPPPRTTTRTVGPGVGPWIVVGAGGAGLVAGGVLWLVASTQRSALDSMCPGDAMRVCTGLTLEQIDARVGSINGLSTGAVIAGSVGAAATVGGVLWYVLAPRRTEEIPLAVVLPSRNGATVSIGGRF
ncbi:MAG: hypothetical protein JNK05_14065 [Myxococcales bacterium]|nr:hypothetical protein [Myxococcales bacterium]